LNYLTNCFKVGESTICIHASCSDFEQDIPFVDALAVLNQLLVPSRLIVCGGKDIHVWNKFKLIWDN
jgi:hypothetical protein